MLQKQSKEVVNRSSECEEDKNNDSEDGHFQINDSGESDTGKDR